MTTTTCAKRDEQGYADRRLYVIRSRQLVPDAKPAPPKAVYDLVILDVGLPEYRWPAILCRDLPHAGVKSPF